MNQTRSVGMALSLALLACSAPSSAQTAEALAFFKDVNTKTPAPPRDMLSALLTDAFEQAHRMNPQICVPSSIAMSDVKPATADASVWAGIRNGQLKNAWTVRADMQGCPVTFANYIVLRFSAEPTGKPAFREIISSRGTTHAGFSLSKDATMGAMGAVAANAEKITPNGQPCTEQPVFGIREMVDDRKAGPDIYGVRFTGAWTEKWHFQLCAHDIAVPITFTADGQGGAYYHTDVRAVEVR